VINVPIIGLGRKSALWIYRPVRAQGIEGAGPPQVAIGPGTGRNPRKARFFAEQKMCPNGILKKYPVFVNSL
jgi:hypothetical protein